MTLLILFGHFFLTLKSQVYNILLSFYSYFSTQFKPIIKIFQCNHGSELDNNLFKDFYNHSDNMFRFSCSYISSQNDKAERIIRTLNKIQCTLLFHASLPPSFWINFLEVATYLINIHPSDKSAS